MAIELDPNMQTAPDAQADWPSEEAPDESIVPPDDGVAAWWPAADSLQDNTVADHWIEPLRRPLLLFPLREKARKRGPLLEIAAGWFTLLGTLGGFICCAGIVASLRYVAPDVADQFRPALWGLTGFVLSAVVAAAWYIMARRARTEMQRFAEGNLTVGGLLWNLLSRETPDGEPEQTGPTKLLQPARADDVGLSFRRAVEGFPRLYRRWCANYGMLPFPHWTMGVWSGHWLAAVLTVVSWWIPFLSLTGDVIADYALSRTVSFIFLVMLFISMGTWWTLEQMAVQYALLRLLEGDELPLEYVPDQPGLDEDASVLPEHVGI